MAEHEFDDLTVSVELSYQEAEAVADMLVVYGSPERLSTVESIRRAMSEAVKERRRQDRAPIG